MHSVMFDVVITANSVWDYWQWLSDQAAPC